MAIDFDGTDDCIKTSGSGANILRDASFANNSYFLTISCWARPHGRHNGTIWSQYLTSGSGSNGRLALEIQDSSMKFKLRFTAGYTSTSSSAYTDDSDTWYHLLCTFSWPDRYLYINGDVASPAVSNTGNRNSLHETDELATVIGAKLATGDYAEEVFFNGDIAEWAAWKVVLSAGEIVSLANGASPLFVRPNDLLAYFPLGGPYVDSSNAYRDITAKKSLTASDSPTFVETPIIFQTTSGMFYPNTYMGNDTVPFTQVEEEEDSAVDPEAALTGSDVIHEIITANDRKQGGICVNSGGVTFSKRGNDIQIPAQNQITELDTKYVKENRQDHRDETSTDTNNSDGWFGV